MAEEVVNIRAICEQIVSEYSEKRMLNNDLSDLNDKKSWKISRKVVSESNCYAYVASLGNLEQNEDYERTSDDWRSFQNAIFRELYLGKDINEFIQSLDDQIKEKQQAMGRVEEAIETLKNQLQDSVIKDGGVDYMLQFLLNPGKNTLEVR